MVTTALFYLVAIVAGVFVAILPDASTIPLPSGLTDAVAGFGTFIGKAGAVLPNGTLAQIATASVLVGTVNLIVLPWIVARRFRMPFAGMTKG